MQVVVAVRVYLDVDEYFHFHDDFGPDVLLETRLLCKDFESAESMCQKANEWLQTIYANPMWLQTRFPHVNFHLAGPILAVDQCPWKGDKMDAVSVQLCCDENYSTFVRLFAYNFPQICHSRVPETERFKPFEKDAVHRFTRRVRNQIIQFTAA